MSRFERDGRVLARRLAAIRADGLKTLLYDAIDAALRMCGTSPEGSNPVVSCSVFVMSDGKDEGSAITREELMTRIADSPTPYPIYSLAYSRTGREHFKNLKALSKKSFGVYYMVGKTPSGMRRVVEEVRNMLHGDYVVTLRSYLPADGARTISRSAWRPRAAAGPYCQAVRLSPFALEVE